MHKICWPCQEVNLQLVWSEREQANEDHYKTRKACQWVEDVFGNENEIFFSVFHINTYDTY